MIHAYTWPTSNGKKLHIMLAECDLAYTIQPIDIGAGDQHQPDFLDICPNGKIPAIVDDDGPDGVPISIFESGAILIYLANKNGSLLPSASEDPRGHYNVLQWLMFQVGGVGPMLGQNHHFDHYAPEKIPYAIDRYVNETARLYGVIDRRLRDSAYLAGDNYTIADIATFPWMINHKVQRQNLNDFPNLKRWYNTIANRPAVQEGLMILSNKQRREPLTSEQHANYFGQSPTRHTK
ncbi:glutathione S-transferase family protein [Roseibium sp.]|uniref:glutathione S-transferase family protein n=1 Tax=Roseibium sp. TaxID=1936156 RepID=UPI00329A235A